MPGAGGAPLVHLQLAMPEAELRYTYRFGLGSETDCVVGVAGCQG